MKTNCIIVTHNRLPLLKECLGAVEAQSYPVDKIIVIDNCSTDGTEDFLARQDNRRIEVIRLPQNIGGAGGFSLGIKTSVLQGCDFNWIMDDDTIPAPDALEKLMDVVSGKQNAGFACSQAQWTDGTPHAMNRPALRSPGQGQTVCECLSCSFVSVLVSTAAIRKVGLPVKEFFIWCDDIEFTSRITRAGYTGYYVQDSIVCHKTPENYYPSVDQAPAHAAERFYYQARNACYIKHREQPNGLLFRLSVWNKLRILKRRIRRRKDGHQKEFLDAVTRGCRDGLTFFPEIEYVRQPPKPAADAGEAAKPQPGSPKLLTLVIATYNMERYIGRCLDSVTAPEIPSTLEVIAVNDGSTDRSLEIMESYRKRRPDIVRVIDKPNGHYGSCINAGLQAATGKYFRPLDADDWMDTQALADLLSRLERCDTDLVVTLRTEHRIKENGAMSVTRFPFKGIEYGHAYPLASFDIPGHIKGEEFNMHSMAYKTSLLREVGLRQDEGICYTDFQYCFLPIDRAKDFVVFDLYLYQYFIGREEQSTGLRSIRNNFPHICKVIEYMLRYMDATPGTGGIIRKNQIYFVKKALDIFVVSLRWQSPVTKARYKEILRILQAVERYHIQNRLLDKIYFRPWRKHPTRSILNATLLIYQAVHARRYRKARKKKR